MSTRVVTLGGGTGTFVVLSGLRELPEVELTAIVSSADDDGSTGRLRDAYGILPPGDARQALVALAEKDTMLRELFRYRFAKGDVTGHNLGNLFITALADLLQSDVAALEEASRILRINGRVLSVSEQSTELVATLADGTILKGEGLIDTRSAGRSPIREMNLSKEVHVSSSARKALEEADFVVLGPGDLHTSTIAALLPNGVQRALKKSPAKMVCVVNLFTKAGQTDGYTASKYVQEVERYAGRAADVIFLDNTEFPEEALTRYAGEGEHPITDDLNGDARVIRGELASVHMVPPVPEDPVPRSLIRHDSTAIAKLFASLL